jgi:hypothetical protein
LLPALLVHARHSDQTTRSTFNATLLGIQPILGIHLDGDDLSSQTVDPANMSEFASRMHSIAAQLQTHYPHRQSAAISAAIAQLSAASEPQVRAAAALLAGALLQLLPPTDTGVHLAAAEQLLVALKDSDSKVRTQAAKALGSVKLSGNPQR